ncbi:MAG: sensor histidine kinase [Synechococcus sp.]
MDTPSPWRQWLLGSLPGQLQLATYLAVFLGFTSASIAGLILTRRNQALLGEGDLRSNAQSLERSLLADRLLEVPPGESPAALTRRTQAIREQLRWHSSSRHVLWIERPDGKLLLPADGTLPLDPVVPKLASRSGIQPGINRAFRVKGQDHIAILTRIYPSGLKLWSSAEVTRINQAQTAFLNWMIVIWASCLVMSLLIVNRLVRRIIRPLRQLNEASSQLTADTLNSSVLRIESAPLEVEQLANTYNGLRSRLAKSWSDQRRFVSAVSHELRTPLTIVQGYVYRTLNRSDNLTEPQRKGLRTAEEETLRMRHLLDDLLDLSRSDSGQLRLQHQEVEMNIAVLEAVDMARSSMKREVLTELPLQQEDSRLIVAQADPDRLRQVLLDLIENAHKYSPEGKPVTVRLSQVEQMAVVEVVDQGIGIPPKDLPKVFDRFHRASNASVSSGSGLGLSIVQLLVEAMGGTVVVTSQLGQGSIFTVHLPISHAEAGVQSLVASP